MPQGQRFKTEKSLTSFLIGPVDEEVHGADLSDLLLFSIQPQDLLTASLHRFVLHRYRRTVVTGGSSNKPKTGRDKSVKRAAGREAQRINKINKSFWRLLWLLDMFSDILFSLHTVCTYRNSKASTLVGSKWHCLKQGNSKVFQENLAM